MAKSKAITHDLISDRVLGKYENEQLEVKRVNFVRSCLEKTESQEFF